jgi:hypothetical protein
MPLHFLWRIFPAVGRLLHVILRLIFQNWEALAYSYPEFIENMISTFLNATTADGYNPYRITYQGVDWEIPEPANPWANIGYWSDHQII